MKLKYSLAALAAAAFVLAGCEHNRQAGQLTPKQQETVEAFNAEQRAVYVAAMNAKLADMDQKITELGDTIASLNTDDEAQATFNSLRDLRSQLDPLLQDVANSSGESWRVAKQGFETAWVDLELAYKAAKATYDT